MGAMAAWPRTYRRRCVRFPADPWLLDGPARGAADRGGHPAGSSCDAQDARPTLSLVGCLAFAAAAAISPPVASLPRRCLPIEFPLCSFPQVCSAESLVSKPRGGEFGLYLLVFPDAQAADRIEMLAHRCRSEYGLHGKPRPRSILHVSLLNLGLYNDLASPKLVALEAIDAAEQVRATPFTVAFNYVQSFSHPDGRCPLVLRGDDGIVGLEMLYQSLGMSMRMAGFKTRPAFTPHVTLIYSHRPVSERSIEPITWTVREFSLVLSLRGKTKYILLDRWPLGADL